MLAVIDTNVIVSGLLYPSHPPGEIVDMIFSRQVVPIYDDRIVNEYTTILRRPKFSFPRLSVDVFLENLQLLGERVVPLHQNISLPDEKDRCFVECAIASGKLIITGNKKHFPTQATKTIKIFSPAEFIANLKP
jgi:uncharacterized protein